MSGSKLSLACPARLFESAVAFGLSLLFAASEDITTPTMLFYRISIIAEGNSMRELKEALKSGIGNVFDDLCNILPTLHEKHPDGPAAMRIFMAVIMGVVLKAEKKEGALDCLAMLLAAVHVITHPLRSLQAGSDIPNSHRVDLFTAILDLLYDTIPLNCCPMGFGNPLNPSEFMKAENVQQKLGIIQNLVHGMTASVTLD
ncbi:hypothetical protein DL96DRAFT_202455 [Flagelloscypha sp. PMI_526]|nr:hypothetical protein DL96DRAFT_202455 [Flagelloscypha sp. PMI_526]